MGKGLVNSDIRFEGKNLKKLLFYSFFGGFISGAFGQGGGSIFNPVLIEMGVPPSVAGATGMYMVMFSSFSSSIMFLMSN